MRWRAPASPADRISRDGAPLPNLAHQHRCPRAAPTPARPLEPPPADPDQAGAFTPNSTSAVCVVPVVRPGAVWYCQYMFVWAITSPGDGAP